MTKNSWYLRRHIDAVLNFIDPRSRATKVQIVKQRNNALNELIRTRKTRNDITFDYKHYDYILRILKGFNRISQQCHTWVLSWPPSSYMARPALSDREADARTGKKQVNRDRKQLMAPSNV